MKINNFDELINDNLVLVDFYANWCGPCKMISPLIEQLDVKKVKVNVDDNQDLSIKYGVMSIPTLILFKNGEMVDKRVGFQNIDALKSWIDEYK